MEYAECGANTTDTMLTELALWGHYSQASGHWLPLLSISVGSATSST